MTKGYISGIDFAEGFNAQRYWSFPSSYSKEKKHEELNKILYSDDYVGACKMDGYFERIVKDEDGNIMMISRNKGVNGILEKSGHVPHLKPFFDSLPKGTVLLGEVYLPNKTSKNIVSILGCLEEKAIARQEKDKDKLRLYIFDVLMFDHTSIYKEPMIKRIKLLNELKKHYREHFFVEFAEYWTNPDDIRENWLKILAEGGEGIVLTKKDYPYEFGKRTARKTLKLKKELQDEISVIITGRYKEPTKIYTGKLLEQHPYWFDEVTGEKIEGTLDSILKTDTLTPVTKGFFYGWAGSIEIGVLSEKENKIIPIGFISGITEEIKKGIITNNERYKNRVCDLQCMEIDKSNIIPSLRHARFLGFRDDSTIYDATWEKAFGEEKA